MRPGSRRWAFAHDPRYATLLHPFGVHGDDDAFVELDGERLLVRFGRWTVSTPVRNLAGAQVMGPFSAPKVIGPHLSFADRGVTFGSATSSGTCIRFHVPVPGIEPLGVLRHPGVTVTVDDPDSLAAAVEERAATERTNGFRRSEPADRPATAERAVALLRYPWGLAVNTVRYLRHAADIERTETAGDASDLPPELPGELVDAHLKAASEGDGPLLHRTFRVRVSGAGRDAAALIDHVTADLDRAAPSEVATFRKERGRTGEMRVGDEYRVRMPAPWDGPVRVVHRDRTSFRFATLDGHMEAGQIEFSARDAGADELEFLIEAWSRPGDRPAAVAIDRLGVGKEIQLHMWTQFCLSVAGIAGGLRDGPVRVHTRRVTDPFHGTAPSRPARPGTPRP